MNRGSGTTRNSTERETLASIVHAFPGKRKEGHTLRERNLVTG